MPESPDAISPTRLSSFLVDASKGDEFDGQDHEEEMRRNALKRQQEETLRRQQDNKSTEMQFIFTEPKVSMACFPVAFCWWVAAAG